MTKFTRFFTAFIAAAALVAGCGGPAHRVHPPGWGYPPVPCHLCTLPGTQPLSGTVRMYDSVTIGEIPRDPFAVAGYTSGFFPTYIPLRQAFPRSHAVSIAVSARNRADCLDVEPGDASPDEVPGWVRADINAGFRKPCVYSSYWELVNEVRPQLQRAGIPRSAVFEWDADYLGCPRLDAGFDATQCTEKAFGRNLDESVVKLAFLNIATPPYTVSRSQLRRFLGAYNRRTNPHGHNCQHPPYRHAYPSARWDHACAVWAREVR